MTTKALFLLVLLFPATISVDAQAPAATITFDLNQRYQTLDGFGVSINTGWWYKGKWGDGALVRPAIDRLVDSLGASLFRAVIEDVDWETANDDDNPAHFNMDYYNRVFTTSRFEGIWNTLRYLNGKGIAEGRLILSFMGAPPSAPVGEPADPLKSWMGGTDYSIHPDMEDEFVETIAAFLYYARHTAGIRFSLIAPLNETEQVADARNSEHPEGVLEGPNIPDARQVTRILHKLIERLDNLGMNDLRMVGPDAAGTRLFRDCVTNMVQDPLVLSRLAAWGIHQYGGSTAENEAILRDSGQPDAVFWVTEMAGIDNLFTQLTGKGKAFIFWDGFDSVYQHARRNNYGDEPPNDWVFWEGDEGRPLIAFHPETATWSARTQFHQFAGIFRSVKPGAVRIGTQTTNQALLAVAFVNPDNRVVLAGMNNGPESIRMKVPQWSEERILAPGEVFTLHPQAQTDQSHYSKVFGREKPYRIFLPAGYSASTQRYPVIYYFHGNTGSHELDIPGVQQLVDDNRVILVAWNGRSIDSDLRPYNIGNHSNINYPYQFKDYFPELVAHIDSRYRTVPDRQHRAVIGHSMGGIMSFFIAGKYPDWVCSAYNSKGSPEFFIGYPDQHSLYHVRHMFKNLHGVRLGFSSATRCELKNLNAEVIQGALTEKGLDFQYRIYEGEHNITPDQFKDAVNFTMESFRNPPAVPLRWHHADLYPDFAVWGYEVHSNLKSRGFIELKGVTRDGLGIRTRAWEPDGVAIPGVQIQVKTPSYYKPNTSYTLLNYNASTDSKTISGVASDDSGRITITSGPDARQFGIFQKNDPAEITLARYRVNGSSQFLDHKKECRLSLELLNRGGSTANHITVNISSPTPGVTISNPVITLGNMNSGDLTWLPADFLVTAANPPTVDGSPFKVRFNLVITDGKNHTWEDEFDAAAFYSVPEFTSIGIDDGDSEIFGSGNGNNIAEPGETLMIYEISNGSHRLRLYYDDPYIDSERLYDEIQPDKWGDGYSLSSLIHISKDCPPGHQIKFLACYEIKDWKEIRRDVTWGTFTITVGDPHEP